MNALPWPRGATGLAARLFGGTCYLCRGDSDDVLCAPCLADLPRLGRPRCPRCALPALDGKTCGRCLADAPSFDATTAVFAYAFPADVLVQGLKFRGELALAPMLARHLVAELAAEGPDAADFIVPVPLHEQRLRERGYNQSMEIARKLAKTLGLAVQADLCIRVRDTATQLGLSLKERHDNLRGAFSCRRDLEGRRVAVVDDVMTSGATLDELAATLKRFGASHVVNWVVARTPDP